MDIPTRLLELEPTLTMEVELLHRKLQQARKMGSLPWPVLIVIIFSPSIVTTAPISTGWLISKTTVPAGVVSLMIQPASRTTKPSEPAATNPQRRFGGSADWDAIVGSREARLVSRNVLFSCSGCEPAFTPVHLRWQSSCYAQFDR